MSCENLWQSVQTFALKLLQMGLNKGDCVAVILSNSNECAVCIFGTMAAVGVVGCVSSEKSDGCDVKEMVEQISCRFAVFDTGNKAVCTALNYEIAGIEAKASTQSIMLLCLSSTGGDINYASFTEIYACRLKEQGLRLPSIFPEDKVLVFTTSGTTGRPKLVVQTHFSMMNAVLNFCECMEIKAGEIYYSDRPFPWSAGFPIFCTVMGVTRIFMDTRQCNSPNYTEILCDILLRENCHAAFISAHTAKDLAKSNVFSHISDWKPIRLIVFAGQRITKTIIDLIGGFCEKVLNIYASTEIGPVCVSVLDCPTLTVDCDSLHPLMGCECKIGNPEGQVVPVNTTGEIFVRSHTCLVEYMNNPTETQKAIDAKTRWIRTGDVGHITENGKLVVEGRVSDIISRGTRKIIPAAIENEVIKCSGVAVAMAVPVPDERLLQEVCICVIAKPGSTLTVKQIEGFCERVFLKEEALDSFGLRPKYCLLLDEFPRLPNGKYARRLLATRAAVMLGLQ